MTFRELLNHFDISAILKKYMWNIWKTRAFECITRETSEKHVPFNVLVLFSRRSAALTRQIVLQMISFYTGGFLQTRNLFAVFYIHHVDAAWFGLLLHF